MTTTATTLGDPLGAEQNRTAVGQEDRQRDQRGKRPEQERQQGGKREIEAAPAPGDGRYHLPGPFSH